MIYLQWMSYYGNRRKTQNTIKRQNETKEKIFPVWLPSHPTVYEMEADCFPVSENTGNKPELL